MRHALFTLHCPSIKRALTHGCLAALGVPLATLSGPLRCGLFPALVVPTLDHISGGVVDQLAGGDLGSALGLPTLPAASVFGGGDGAAVIPPWVTGCPFEEACAPADAAAAGEATSAMRSAPWYVLRRYNVLKRLTCAERTCCGACEPQCDWLAAPLRRHVHLLLMLLLVCAVRHGTYCNIRMQRRHNVQ